MDIFFIDVKVELKYWNELQRYSIHESVDYNWKKSASKPYVDKQYQQRDTKRVSLSEGTKWANGEGDGTTKYLEKRIEKSHRVDKLRRRKWRVS